ncbi:MAG: chromosome partitioning protein ParB [Solirubrobacterales bacterium]|nr:chromosome partitioning protein ParB [Solirubrobacterales bacterium]
MARDTGFPASDAQDDFLRARRRHALARVSAAVRREPDDVDVILPFDEVVAALGRISERDLGHEPIALDSIVGTVDRGKEFDRHFRPASARVRLRFERIANAQRRGESMPPIDVYRIGEVHFVRDGHHRVAVARAQRLDVIDAHVVEVLTRVGADASMRLGDLPMKSHERLFHERVPLRAQARSRIRIADPEGYGALAEGVEAWGFRLMQAERELMDRTEVARRWFEDEYVPVVEMLREADLIGRREHETDAYGRLTGDRFRLMRTQQWSDEAIERVRRGR